MSYRGIYSAGATTTTTHTGTTGSGVLPLYGAPPAPRAPLDWNSTSPPQHSRSLYHSIPLPRVSQDPVQLHQALERAPNPMVVYSVLDHPTTAMPTSCLPYLQERWKQEPATTPGLTHLTIRVPSLDRPIVINQVYTHNPVVTVNDVLNAVYMELRKEAYQLLCHGGRMHGGLWANPHPQYVHPQQAEEDIRRVVTQMLGGRMMWDGLTLSKHECDVWVLHVR